MGILGDGRWPQTAQQEGDRIIKQFLCNVWKKRDEPPNVGGASLPLLGVGTVLRLERDAWSMIK